MEPVQQALKDAGLTTSELGQVLLVGGWWLIKLLRHIVKKALQKAKAEPTVISFLDSLILGMRITTYSASFYEEEEEETGKERTPEQAARAERWIRS